MLTSLRNASQGWLGRIIVGVILGLLTVAFAIWGISDVFRGFGRASVATIGTVEITEERFRNEYDRERQELSRRIGRQVTADQARLFGIAENLLSRMTAEAAMDQRARELVLGMSDEAVARSVVDDPNYRVSGGRFDAGAFREWLRQNGMTEQTYIAQRRQLLIRRQIAEGLAGRIDSPRVMEEAIHRFQTERRVIQYATVPAERFGTVDPPTDQVLSTYFDITRSAFRAPENRQVNVLVLNAEALAGRISVSDQDLAQAYEARRSTYVTAERRTLRQITFPDRESATAARERLNPGFTFDQLAAELGRSPADLSLGTLTAIEVLDPEVRAAAFSLGAGVPSGVVSSRFGPVIVIADAIEAEQVRTLAEVSSELRVALQRERGQREILDMHDKVEDERASGSRLAEVARKLELPFVEVAALDSSGRDLAGAAIGQTIGGNEVVAAIFRNAEGFDADPVQVRGQGFIWFDVQRITPSRERSLDEVRQQVVERWTNDQRANRMNGFARELVTRINAGRPIAEVAAEAGLSILQSEPFARSGQVGDLGAGVGEAAFATAKDRAGSANTGTNGMDRVVFVVTSSEIPPFTALEDRIIQDLDRTYGDDILGQYVARLERDLGVRVNRTIVDRITGGTAP
jgi:peptidyl-prolyl cis-trans isomerase D